MTTRKLANIVLLVGVIDALLLLVLLYVAVVDRNEAAISVLGPIHGAGYVLLLALTTYGWSTERWGWWFPVIVLVTGGPLGSLIGEIKIRRDLRAAPATA